MEKFQLLLRLCMIGVPVFGILGILCAFGWNYYGLKIKELEKAESENKNHKNSSNAALTQINKTTYVVKGDIVHGNKEIKHEEIIAPNALIVTKNQSGGQNIVNYFQNEFVPLSNEIENQIDNRFSLLSNKDNVKIIIEIEANNSQRNKIAMVLEKFLIKYNLGAYPKGNIYMGRFPDDPVSLIINSKNKNFADEVVEILQLYIKDGIKIIQNDKFPSNIMKIYINGQPLFDRDGTLKIE